MRAIILAICIASLAACADPVKDAQRELEIVKQTGDLRAICAAERKVADATLKAQRGLEYQLADTNAKIACQEADLAEL